MARSFGKRPNDYLNLQTTKELIDEMTVTSQNGNGDNQLVITERGGTDGGASWLQEDLALDYAQWLSIKFKVWCNSRIKELLQKGYTKLDSISRKDLAKMLFESEEAKKEHNRKSFCYRKRRLDRVLHCEER
jgi:hypothetical protein